MWMMINAAAAAGLVSCSCLDMGVLLLLVLCLYYVEN